jgi:phage tail tape-measure protein
MTIWQIVISDADKYPRNSAILKCFSAMEQIRLSQNLTTMRAKHGENGLSGIMQKAQEASRRPNALGFAINNSLARRTEMVHDLRQDLVEECGLMISLS